MIWSWWIVSLGAYAHARHAQIKAYIFKPNTVVLFTLSAQTLQTYMPLRRGAYAPHSTGLISSSHGPTDSLLVFRNDTPHAGDYPGRRSRACTAYAASRSVVLVGGRAAGEFSGEHVTHGLCWPGLRGGPPLMRSSAMSNFQRHFQRLRHDFGE